MQIAQDIFWKRVCVCLEYKEATLCIIYLDCNKINQYLKCRGSMKLQNTWSKVLPFISKQAGQHFAFK